MNCHRWSYIKSVAYSTISWLKYFRVEIKLNQEIIT